MTHFELFMQIDVTPTKENLMLSVSWSPSVCAVLVLLQQGFFFFSLHLVVYGEKITSLVLCECVILDLEIVCLFVCNFRFAYA